MLEYFLMPHLKGGILMIFWQNKNLLPKGEAVGVALKTLFPQHQLLRFRGVLKKRFRLHTFSFSTKLSLGGVLVLYLLGYQPTFALPPLRKAIVRAEFSQEQQIDSTKLSEAFTLPHPGYLTTHFSQWHPGIDIATGLGMLIHPIASGTVVETTYGFFGLGHYVVVEHQQGYRSTYGHMGEIYVKKGDKVTANSYLGEVGMTGRTTGPHTHLEITKNGSYTDPQKLLPTISTWPQYAGTAPSGAGIVKKIQKVKKSKEEEENFKLQLLPINLGKTDNQPVEKKPASKLPLLLLQPGQTSSQTAPAPDLSTSQ